MSKLEFALQSSLFIAIASQGFVSGQTGTPPPRSPVSSQQSRTTPSRNQTATPIEEIEPYKEEDFGLEPSPEEAKRFYKHGVKYRQLKLYNEAIAAFELAILLRPNYREAYLGLGNTYADMGRWKEAGEAFRKAVQLNLKDDEAYARFQEANAKLAREEKARLSSKSSPGQNNIPATDRVGGGSRLQPNTPNAANAKTSSAANAKPANTSNAANAKTSSAANAKPANTSNAANAKTSSAANAKPANKTSNTFSRETTYSPLRETYSQTTKPTSLATSGPPGTRQPEKPVTPSNASPTGVSLANPTASSSKVPSNVKANAPSNTPAPRSVPNSGSAGQLTANPAKNSVPSVTGTRNVESAAVPKASLNSRLDMAAEKAIAVNNHQLQKLEPRPSSAVGSTTKASTNTLQNLSAKTIPNAGAEAATKTAAPVAATNAVVDPSSKTGSEPKTIPTILKNSSPNLVVNKNNVSAAPETSNNPRLETGTTRTSPAANATSKGSKKDADVGRIATPVTPSRESSGANVTSTAEQPKNGSTKTAPEPVSDARPSANAADSSKVEIYRIGIGDVLEIRVSDAPVDHPTVFTVSSGGFLDYPALNEPLAVAGLTPDEVGQKLSTELKRRALSQDDKIIVAVRDYNSHTILVSGLVAEPGTKLLRREAIPLYVVLAEAQPFAEAGRVTVISQAGSKTATVDLGLPEATSLLIHPGDVVVVQANPKLFFYIGGEVKEPGEKPFREGLKLTQAIIKAGGLIRASSRTAEVAREGSNGLLEVTTYRLNDISSGKQPDPLVQPGDRITIID